MDNKMDLSWVKWSLIWIACIGFSSAKADTFTSFPAQGDYASSGIWGDGIAGIQLTVAPALQPYFAAAGIAGYDSTTHIYSSGLLYDPGPVKLGASSAFAGPAPVGGVAAGSANYTIKASDLTAPTGFTDNGGREVYAYLPNWNLTSTTDGAAIRSGAAAPDQKKSVGEFQSTTGNPANDFPAQSFFDIFVDVDIPSIGTLYNTSPIITNPGPVSGQAGMDSGPYYIFGFQSTTELGASVFARADGPGQSWRAGDEIGTLQIVPFGGLAAATTPLPSAALGGLALFGMLMVQQGFKRLVLRPCDRR